MPVKDVEANIARLRARHAAQLARIAELEPEARAAVVDGKVLNGKMTALATHQFQRDTLADEIKRLVEQELPGAQAAEDEAGRQRHLVTARSVHRKTMMPEAARLDAALAEAERALAGLMQAQRGYAVAMTAAGQGQRAPHWQDMLRRVVWEQSPRVAGLLGVSRAVRTHASTMAEIMERIGPPGG